MRSWNKGRGIIRSLDIWSIFVNTGSMLTRAVYILKTTEPIRKRYPLIADFKSRGGCRALYFIYCKRGEFLCGKISRKCLQDLSRGSNFHETSPISLIKPCGLYFGVWGFLRRRQFRDKRENYPYAKVATCTVGSLSYVPYDLKSTYYYETFKKLNNKIIQKL